MPGTSLSESVALLSGATSGIGLESAAQLCEAGIRRMVISGRDPEKGERALRFVRQRAADADVVFQQTDARDPVAAKRLVDATLARYGRIDILVNSASGGTKTPRPIEEISAEDAAAIFDVYFWTTFHVCAAAYESMRTQRRGSVINFSSDAAKIATPGETVHGAALAATLMFTRSLALEASRFGIRVNCITPSVTKNTRSHEEGMSQPFSQKLFAKAARRARLGIVEPGNIAPLVVFLAGPGSSHLTGQAISVNGGISVA